MRLIRPSRAPAIRHVANGQHVLSPEYIIGIAVMSFHFMPLPPGIA